MNRTTALFAAAAFFASTTLVTAFYASPIDVPGNVQLAQAKKDDMKKDAMPMDDKMKKEKMEKEKMDKEKMMKDDKMKK